jgi:hypothetical protein
MKTKKTKQTQNDFLNTDNIDLDNNLNIQSLPDLGFVKTQLNNIKDQIESILRFLDGQKTFHVSENGSAVTTLATGEHILEGIFNGEAMIGDDDGTYPVAQNYASKSKLVEGDRLKLTITNSGSFIYKQINPVERERLVGELYKDSDTQQWSVIVNNKPYKVLTASVTFYKAESGDEAVILVPKGKSATWGAVDNIIHK